MYKVTKSQVLHVLTVLVLTPAAGFVSSEVAKILPVSFNSTQLTAIFITGASAALTAGIHYLHGLQLWERTVAKVVDVEDDSVATPGPVSARQQVLGDEPNVAKAKPAAARRKR